MPSLPLPSSTPTIEEKLAKLCVRPHLSSDVLPRFVLIMLECALHSFLCSFAACVMELILRYRRGELEPWPDEPEDDALTTRIRTSKMKSPPAAPRRSAGATPVQAADAGLDASDTAEQAATISKTQRPALPRRMDARQRPMPTRALAGQERTLRADRCRPTWVCGAAEMRRETCAQIVPVN